MLASAVVAGLLVGAATGGSWRKLGDLRLRWWAVFAVAITLRVAAALLPEPDAARATYVVALWTLLFAAALNLMLPGARLITAGLAANVLVVSANGGAMPVSADAVAASGTRAPTDALHVVQAAPAVLGDLIPVPLVGVYSIGDLLLAIGVFVLIVWTMRS